MPASRARLFSASILCCFAAGIGQAQMPGPPSAARIPVTETIHGVAITDNYRWLEEQNSPQTRAWIAGEQKYTNAFFATLPSREQIRASLSKIERVESVSVPFAAGARYFFTRRLPSEEQASLFVRDRGASQDVLLSDPNTSFPDHSVSVSVVDASRDGKILAYQFRKGGQDETEIHFLDVSSRKELPDRLPKGRIWALGGYAFTPDNMGFYYTRFIEAGPRVYVHHFGTAVSADREIFGNAYGPEYFAVCGITRSARYLFCEARKGSSGAEADIYIQRLENEKTLRCIARHMPLIHGTEIYRDHLVLLTGSEAPNGRVLDIDLDHPARGDWKEIVHEGRAPIAGISIAANKLFVTTVEDVSSRCRALKPDGTPIGDVKLPTLGEMGGVSGQEDGTEAFFAFSSFAYPITIFRLDSRDAATVWFRPSVPLALGQIQVQQVWYSSKDGTKMPMFLVSKKGQPLRNLPTLLSGYGGFDVTLLPAWSPPVADWVERGGVYAQPSLRGGGEFGEAWHRAGMFEKKQNVFDDFITAAEYLVHTGVTSPAKLAIEGVSNGGLLVGVAVTQRPDLFGAVVCGAPLLDMVRYQKFKVAKFWISEYGSSEDAKQFEYLYRYSPYHHVEKGVRYPAVLFWSGDSDTRVDPLHARKMTALMQQEAAPGRAVLLRYDTLAGHSAGMSVDRRIDLDTDVLAFLESQTGSGGK